MKLHGDQQYPGGTLNDRSIRNEIRWHGLDISPFNEENLQPNSYDLRLGSEYSFFSDDITHIDSREDVEQKMVSHEISDGNYYVLKPDDFMLVNTIEEVKMPEDLVGELTGRSSIGRLGIEVHSTAGLIDAGFEGDIVLEISSNVNVPVRLYPGMRVAQIIFRRLTEPARNPYDVKGDSKYQGQKGAVGSRIHEDG